MAKVEEHKIGPPLEEVDAQSKYSNHYNIVQRYGIEQGVDELGSPKFRCIDNHLDNQNNDAVERRQKVPMASLAHIVLMIRALYASLKDQALDEEWDLVAATEDRKAEYRQCPLLSSQIKCPSQQSGIPTPRKCSSHKCMANLSELAMQCHTSAESLSGPTTSLTTTSWLSQSVWLRRPSGLSGAACTSSASS